MTRFFQSVWLRRALLLVFLAAGFGVRLLNLYDPPLDFHPVRQLRSAVIARGVYYSLNTLADPNLRAKAMGLATVDIHEPPINEQIMGLIYYLTGGERLWEARILSDLYWLIAALAFYGIARRYISFWPVLLGLAFFLFLPFGVVASRAFMPDPGMVMWILLAAYATLRWSEKPDSWRWAVTAGALAGIGILWKVVAGFFLAGVMVLLVLQTVGLRGFLRSLKPWVMALLALTPALVYYLLLHGERASEYFTYNTVELASLILTSKFYAQWAAMVNGLVGLAPVAAGLLGMALAKPRLRLLLAGLWLGYLAYALTWPFQYTTHEYYHLSLVAIVGLSLTPLLELALDALKNQPWIWRLAGAAVFIAAIGYQGWVARSQVVASDKHLEPRSWELVGLSIPPGEPFVALTGDYGLRLSYYGWRVATVYWPAIPDLEAANLRGQTAMEVSSYFKDVTAGKNFFLVTALTDFDQQPELKTLLNEHYPVYHQGNGFVVYDLRKPLKSLDP